MKEDITKEELMEIDVEDNRTENYEVAIKLLTSEFTAAKNTSSFLLTENPCEGKTKIKKHWKFIAEKPSKSI